MFHQIKVCKKDQDALRFLWWDSDDINLKPSEYAFCRHIFGATDSPCIVTSALRKTASDNRNHYNELTIKTVSKDFYVDDLLTSVPTVDIAIELGHNLCKLCEKGGINLIKFNSNSKEVLSTFPAEKLEEKTIDLDFDQLSKTKALGIQWNVENDTLGFDVVDLQKPNTMRGVLSTICSVFDPLNIIAPVLLPAKLIMQELWRKQWKWDRPLEGQLLDRWVKWKKNLHTIENVKIQRCYFSHSEHSNCNIQLHHFSDSSEFAYGSVSFLRIQYDNGNIESKFIMGKSRNAPLKVVSIARLELQAAVLATRMSTFIVYELELKFESITFWTDLMIVLNYINNTNRRFKTFVANRVTELHESTTPDQWKYCPGIENPADDVSRGMNPEQLVIFTEIFKKTGK
ncbi:hypothetical protein SNE40_021971 [Patella caerulea]|uniref:Uncharacterized protein n=1 Tax=Patella caerulea TaxID=87958 RepID=A0AAN8G0P2_PATCE